MDRIYYSPKVDVIEILVESFFAQSGDNNNENVMLNFWDDEEFA